MRSGQLLAEGPPDTVMKQYNAAVSAQTHLQAFDEQVHTSIGLTCVSVFVCTCVYFRH